MKAQIYILLFGALLLASACELDNFQEPDAFFTGHIVYQGEPIPVARNQVWFELWQPGFGLSAPIDVAIAQDGSYSSRLFSGQYQLAFLPGEGPFRAPTDTIFLDLNGDEIMELEVTPYYMIRTPQFSHSGGTVSASCSLDQIITGDEAREVERVTLIINRTQFVDANSGGEGSLAQSNAADISDLSRISLSVDIPEDAKKPDQGYYFARIGVKIAGVEDMIYTQVEKVSL
ncbi:DUF3823 domain-containing protein [Flavilitoribacter nigricans]|uniref:DUF3823 domain-containing protein n=1 Tax=Flavilitoribacter nigricans (strain ATCC 23147 / DSM 23189 / NBRC 102662 / NCIMB 1420 / SS-2) TaxID=1122177 RepID=A0A2D0NE85_FLAN2|nr:DUF3823 domain-containing protein [Flavilitoribacter nigricans]PHN06795.1 hypothetical protein CRP01_10935 [Flavilitoribacter nigricans DSM 23189 = NBRC 102662]